MSETERILRLWAECESAGEEAVLATVIKTQGSSYRLPGARLLLTQLGRRAGSVSGGCLEDDLVKRAWWLTENGPVVRRYDTTPDGDIAAEYGLGCNGIIHVLLERVKPNGAPVFDLIREARSRRAAARIAHLIDPSRQAGLRILIDTFGREQHQCTDSEVIALLRETLSQDIAGIFRCDHGSFPFAEVFVETLAPAIRLLIFGAGDDSVSVVNLARHLGWEAHVFDGRSHYARSERFPGANSVVIRNAGMAGHLALDPWTAAIVMSHSYSQDLEVFRELAGRPLNYLGMLGPQKRTRQLIQDAALTESSVQAEIFSPMGLDIGAEGPDQVALAVISEIQAVMNGRGGGLLRDRRGSIHATEDSVPADEPGPRSPVCV